MNQSNIFDTTRFSSTYIEDIEYIIEKSQLNNYANQTILITGATGLIGKLLVYSILFWNIKNIDNQIKLKLSVRNEEKAKKLFGDAPAYIVSNITDLPNDINDVDYIIHCASSTSSKDFVNKPVETIETSINGTKNILECAKRNNVKSVVYLSSMEVYGSSIEERQITENSCSFLDTTDVRSSYPESKRMCENLCVSYFYEYGVPVNIIRLTQTIGPGIEYLDGRVFAEFMRCVIEERDIVLKTEGKTKRSYVYTADAINAIFCILKDSNYAEAYNVANEESYCSIKEMAQLVAEISSKINVIINISDENNGYMSEMKMNLSTHKIQDKGWTAKYSLKQMYIRMINDAKFHREQESYNGVNYD